jgi:hypothetical protein
MANTDVAVGIDDVFIGKDAIGNTSSLKLLPVDHLFPRILYSQDFLFFLFGHFFNLWM